HGGVEQEHVGGSAREHREKAVAVGGLAHYLHVRLCRHDLPQTRLHDGVVVRDDDADHAAEPGPPWPGGMHTVTEVPPWGAARTPTSPPHGRTRSRMPRRPNARGSSMARSLMPRPLSCTSSTSSSGVARRWTWTRGARAWRTTLVRASWRMRNTSVERSESIRSGCGGRSSVHSMPVRCANCRAAQSIAAESPRLSSTAGRSSVASVRTLSTIWSISPAIWSVLRRRGWRSGSGTLCLREHKAILSAVQAWASAAWFLRSVWVGSEL